jgi:hypothetical protein
MLYAMGKYSFSDSSKLARIISKSSLDNSTHIKIVRVSVLKKRNSVLGIATTEKKCEPAS